MGQAKQRGNFEKRKQQAIESGRVKRKEIKSYISQGFYPGIPGGILYKSPGYLMGSIAGKYWPWR